MKSIYIYIFAILEGLMLITVEIGFSHLITPYFGSSIQVWSINIVSTMLGLSLGYFLSTLISTSFKNIIYFYLFTILYILFLTIIYKEVLNFGISFEFTYGLVLTSFFLIFVPCTLLAIPIPIIIKNVSLTTNYGKNSGDVYFYSTLSSIVFALLLGFIFFELLGVIFTIKLLSLFTIISLIVIYVKNFKLNVIVTSQLILSITLFVLPYKSNKINYVYESDGLLGKLAVKDMGVNLNNRLMLLNNSPQTMIDKNSGDSKGHYPFLIREIIKKTTYKNNNDVLIVGFGGGTIANEFEKFGYNCIGVELDKRIGYVSKKYFYPDLKSEIIIGDGRFFINTTHQKYDYIVLDVFNSENPPYHVLTKQTFEKISTLLNEKGLLLLNFNGFWTGRKSYSSKAILKTLLYTGFKVNTYPTHGPEDTRNMIFLASKQEITKELDKISYMDNQFISSPLKYDKNLDLGYVPILTDEKPILSILNKNASLKWRKYGIKFIKNNNL